MSTPTHADLTTLTARAQKAYSLKNYPEAVSHFAAACELQSQLHGAEDDPRNAHLLYLYGKALYQVAVAKSDILGGGAAADAPKKQKQKQKEKSEKEVPAAAGKGKVISFQGDENWDDSEGEEEEGEGEGEEQDGGGGAGEDGEDADEDGADGDDDDDDMANAWEVLDLARILFHKTLDPTWTPSSPITSALSSTTTPLPTSSPTTTTLLTHLSDTYDLLGEISLESENFAQSTLDLRSSLLLKQSLLPAHDKLVSEAHYKLSLALEFAAAMEEVSAPDAARGRAEAAAQMELAVASVKARIEVEEALLAGGEGKGKGKGKSRESAGESETRRSLDDAREIVAELESRLADLRAPVPGDGGDEGGYDEGDEAAANQLLGGLLQSVLGQSREEQRRRVEEAVKGANDVSGLVRRKEKKENEKEETRGGGVSGAGAGAKRKLEDVEMVDVVVAVQPGVGGGSGGETGNGNGNGSKKARVEDSLDEEEKKGGSAAVV